jgi:multiple sugar transport system permease protein
MIKNRKALQRVLRLLLYVLILVITVAVVFPLVWMFLTSLKTRDQIFVYPPKFLDFKPTFSNYTQVWVELGFSRLFFQHNLCCNMDYRNQYCCGYSGWI